MTTSGHQELSSREDEIILMISINILGGLLLLITLTVGWWLFRKTKNSLSRYKEVLSKHGKGTEELEELQILHRSSVHNLMFMSERRRSTMDVSIREGSVRHNRRLTSPFDSPLRNSKIGQRYVITFASDGMGDGITISNNIITNISSKSSGDSAGFTTGMVLVEVSSSDGVGSSVHSIDKFRFQDLSENSIATVSLFIPDMSKKNSPPLHRLPLRKSDKGWLGLELTGVTVSDVTEGSPADAAGLKIGMVIRAVEGIPVSENNIIEVVMDQENTHLFHVDVLVKHTDRHHHHHLKPTQPIRQRAADNLSLIDIDFGNSDVNSEGTDSGSEN